MIDSIQVTNQEGQELDSDDGSENEFEIDEEGDDDDD